MSAVFTNQRYNEIEKWRTAHRKEVQTKDIDDAFGCISISTSCKGWKQEITIFENDLDNKYIYNGDPDKPINMNNLKPLGGFQPE